MAIKDDCKIEENETIVKPILALSADQTTGLKSYEKAQPIGGDSRQPKVSKAKHAKPKKTI
jgi:hypothetical protein